MIDIYEQIYNELNAFIKSYVQSNDCYQILRNKLVKVEPEYNANSTRFPYITIGDKGNVYADRELDNQEKHSNLIFDINIYDNSVNKMQICSKLALVVNSFMGEKMGFVRVINEPMPNLMNNTIYRVFQRYECCIDNETGVITKNL